MVHTAYGEERKPARRLDEDPFKEPGPGPRRRPGAVARKPLHLQPRDQGRDQALRTQPQQPSHDRIRQRPVLRVVMIVPAGDRATHPIRRRPDDRCRCHIWTSTWPRSAPHPGSGPGHHPRHDRRGRATERAGGTAPPGRGHRSAGVEGAVGGLGSFDQCGTSPQRISTSSWVPSVDSRMTGMLCDGEML